MSFNVLVSFSSPSKLVESDPSLSADQKKRFAELVDGSFLLSFQRCLSDFVRDKGGKLNFDWGPVDDSLKSGRVLLSLGNQASFLSSEHLTLELSRYVTDYFKKDAKPETMRWWVSEKVLADDPRTSIALIVTVQPR